MSSSIEPIVVRVADRVAPILRSGHPWIYRDHMPEHFSAPTGSWVCVTAQSTSVFGLWDDDSPLAVRVFSRKGIPDAAWYHRRVEEAWALRAPIHESSETNAFRILSGEGDGLPGIQADFYAGFVVIVLDSDAVETILQSVVSALAKVIEPKGILLRRRGPKNAASSSRLELLFGKRAPKNLIVLEQGLRLRADLERGQKTGLFLDQRDNRALVEEIAAGRSVLNLFAYTGAFSLYAVRGGASRVVTVDVAEDAIDDARENFRLNGFDASQHEFLVRDVYEYLEQAASERFELVIVDPPSLARRSDQIRRALRSYEKLNHAALERVTELGLLASASCTARIGLPEFRSMLAGAARKARTTLQVVQERTHALDHPVRAEHPEGQYLKFVLSRRVARD